MKNLERWQNSRRRKPLLVQGARQVGKTWLIQEFGRTHFEKVAYVSFFDDKDLSTAFDSSLDPRRLLDAISVASNTTIDCRDTLVVLDEIQACPRAIMSLKSFAERQPNLAIIGAGSLLGVALSRASKTTSFPVGKVSWLTLYPMTFYEYLLACGEEQLAGALAKTDMELLSPFHERLTEALRRYYYVGGMPEAVDEFTQSQDYAITREIQEGILAGLERDFAKYASAIETERIRLVWDSIPSQLARENKKFIWSAVRPSSRARDFEPAVQWLIDAGMAIRVPRITKPGLPLSAYEDFGAFKLYGLDVGLLGAKSGLSASTLLSESELFTEFKGSLTEQYVCQEFMAVGLAPYYWSAQNSSGEIDFVLQDDNRCLPIEVKAEVNLRAKSLRNFCQKYHLPLALRLSMSPYRVQNEWLEGTARLTNVPLWAAGQVKALARATVGAS